MFRSLIFGGILATLLLSAPALSQSGGTAGGLRLARHLLEEAFPELVGDDARTTVTLETPFNVEWLLSRNVVIHVFPREPAASSAGSDESLSDPWLQARFTFDKERLEYASFVGRRVKSHEMELLTAEAESHPEWTDLQLAKALETAGAKYGPNERQAFADMLRLERFSEALGRDP